MASFTLAHLSDPHLPPLPKPRLIELAGKRVFGYVNWTRNRHKYQRREVLDALVADVKAQAPDHIAVTGDLVNLALDAEFAPARTWLDGVGPPDRVTTIPGNHDAYVRATYHRFGETFAPYLASDNGSAGFPALRRRGPLALISLSTAVPTLPLMATGTLGHDQLAALEQVLERLATEDVFRVLLVHHPLKSDARHKRMTDAADLLALLKRHGVELVLHGHDHIHSTMWFEGPNGNIPAIGVPSASALAHGRYPAAAYNLFTIEKDNAGWRCEQTVRGLGSGFQIREIKHARLV
ncbi:metallophosphatase [Bradyrhizobium sp. CCBAU 45394]|uniref:metallophosphoesterase family protein n=1 Tax=unclassified Bradyrhizobium TaxID=2631580 RepID=UPI0023041CDD|nr:MULTISPECIES: metallophosphoesterase [unclassified Bradyrhizobium]MDA9396630.1 metallophosphatase [Bradyrhizobium sp. CCBAU 45394]MDA9538287.1 metallophosphatase [Bradyrhizobium sp. CCBAU 21362]